MKTIYIVLTRSTTVLSRLVHFVTADAYTHAAIAFDREFTQLYSSGRKNGKTMFPAGPCRESFYNYCYRRCKGDIPVAVYELQVSDEAYELAKQEVASIIGKSDEYHFNIIGLVLCKMNIGLRRKHHLFCSQFVGEVLTRSNALQLPKVPALMRPSDYRKLPELRCCFEGRLNDLCSYN